MEEVDNHIAMELGLATGSNAKSRAPCGSCYPGFNYWLTLHHSIKPSRLLNNYMSSGGYARDNSLRWRLWPANAIRLSLTGPKTRDELRAGLEIVRSCVR